jgi:hypothetical protein
MSILKSEILAFVNEALEAAYSGTDLDVAIQLALDDLAALHVLRAEDTSQSATLATFSLNYPTAALDTEQAILSVVLTDSSGVRGAPLKHLPGGWRAYNELMEAFSTASGSTPAYKVCHDRKIWLYPAPDGTYTSSLWYFKRAQALASGIELEDTWRTCIYFGAAYFKALLMHEVNLLNTWGPQYANEKSQMRLTIQRDSMMEGS